MGWTPPEESRRRPSGRARQKLRDPERGRADDVLDVPPMSETASRVWRTSPPSPRPLEPEAGAEPRRPSISVALARRRSEERGGQPWRSLEELAGDSRVRGDAAAGRERGAARRSEGRRLRPPRPVQVPRGVSFALAGRDRVHAPADGDDRPLRPPARRSDPRRAALLRDRDDPRRRRDGPPRREPRGAADQGRGQPAPPASLGASDAFSQASLYDLYDPDRSQTLLYLEEIRPWPAFLGAIRLAVEAERTSAGAGLRILTGDVASPTLARQIAGILRAFPQARWIQWEPAGRDNARAGARLAFGEPVEPIYHFDRADVVLSLDADFLSCGPGTAPVDARLRLAAPRREGRRGVEPALLGREHARQHGREGGPSAPDAGGRRRGLRAPARGGARRGPGPARRRPVPAAAFLEAAAADLRAHRGRSLVARRRPPAGRRPRARARHERRARKPRRHGRLRRGRRGSPSADQLGDLSALAADMDAGRVRTLVILGGNPRLRRARGPALRRAAREGPAPRAPLPLLRRDLRRAATGTSPRRTFSSRGATRARSTAPPRSSSRSSRRSTAAARRTRSSRRCRTSPNAPPTTSSGRRGVRRSEPTSKPRGAARSTTA